MQYEILECRTCGATASVPRKIMDFWAVLRELNEDKGVFGPLASILSNLPPCCDCPRYWWTTPPGSEEVFDRDTKDNCFPEHRYFVELDDEQERFSRIEWVIHES
jgi:hypothetical protein